MFDYLNNHIMNNALLFWLGWVILPILTEFIPSCGNFIILVIKKIILHNHPNSIDFFPRISIIIPVYNSADTLRGCIKSINDSSYSNEYIDVICIDNGSKDNSFKIFQKCQLEFPTLSLNWLHSAQGKSKALNMAIFNSEGKYIINIDSDGKLEEHALYNIVKKFETNKNIDCMTGAILIDPELIEQTPAGFLKIFRKIEFLEYCQAFLAGRNFQSVTDSIFSLSGAFSALRKSTLIKTRLYNYDTICEDAHLTFQVKELLGRKVSLCEDAIFMVDPIDNINKYYTQRQRWQIGELEVAKMFILKKMKNPFKIFFNSSTKLIIEDHTLTFAKFIWFFVLLILCMTNSMFKIVFLSLAAIYVLCFITNFLFGLNIINFLKPFKEIRSYYIKNIVFLIFLPLYNFFAFLVRFCGIINSISRKASWKTNTFTEEMIGIKNRITKNFDFIIVIRDFFRNILEVNNEPSIKVKDI